MWWAMATITTVGLGRILSAFITFLGTGLTAIPTGIISAGFIEQSQAIKKPKHGDDICPCCGQKIHL